MQLIYFKRVPNFGDQLNPWLWPKLIPNFFEINQQVSFIGIGTLINQKRINEIKTGYKKVIFSTGVGYGDSPSLDDSYVIYCVRGPLSAQALGFSKDLAITDGAALLKKFFKPSINKKYKFSYMPHHSLTHDGWNLACKKIGFGYIDPHWSVEKVLESINETEILLAEAMHGAIVADVLRVPWIPIVSNPRILAFKWNDWCQSLNLEYKPCLIEKLQKPINKSDILSPIRRIRDGMRQKKAAFEMQKIAKNSKPFLSKDKILDELTLRLEEKIDKLQNDIKAGIFD